MTNPDSHVGPEAPITSAEPATAGTQAGSSKRKTPRRASAPAGAPASSAAEHALLIVNADGQVASTTPPVEVGDNDTSTPVEANVEVGDNDTSPPPELTAGALPATTEIAKPVLPTDPNEADNCAGSDSDTDTDDTDVIADAERTAVDTTAAAEPDANSPTDAIPEAPEAPEAIEATEATEATVNAPTADTLPLSRRERRLAEQKLESGLAPSKYSAYSEESTDSAAGKEPTLGIGSEREERLANRNKPVKKRNSFVAFIRGLFFLLVISALVLGIGTVLSSSEDAAVGPSQTEENRQVAWDKTTTLLAQTTALSVRTADSKVQETLNQAAKDLKTQAAALGDGRSSDNTVPASPVTTAATLSIAELALSFSTNGDQLLSNSLTADQAMGRVFAAVGTSQLLQGQKLSAIDGNLPPASAFLPARIHFPGPQGPACKTTLEPRTGVTLDSALGAAALGEQKAIYAYQVATTRFAEPQFSQSMDLLSRHQAKLEVLNAELHVRCLPVVTPVAGFNLAPTFTTTPKKALAQLETELSGAYADLTALSTALSADSVAAADPSSTTTATKPASNTTTLREIAVTWLLDSAQTHVFWGGSIGALAGIQQETTTPTSAAP